jgi:hypothetical protein
MIRIFLLSCLGLLLNVSSAGAAGLQLGGGIRCEGKALKTGSRKVSLSNARSIINGKVSTLVKRIKTLKKQSTLTAQLAVATASVAALRSARRQLTDCTSGKIQNSARELRSFIASNAGTYVGTYSDSLLSGVSGPMSVVIGLKEDSIEGSIQVGGLYSLIFGSSPIVFNRSITGIPFPLEIRKSGTALGDLVVTLQRDGTMALKGTGIDGSFLALQSVSFEGFIRDGSIVGEYEAIGASMEALVRGAFSLQR